MNHAVIVSAHKDFDQLVLLINTMTYADFYIHIDKKSQFLYEELKWWIKESNIVNVFLVEERLDVKWSALSQVKSTLQLMKLVIQSEKKYDYVHFISGQDFPIKSQSAIENVINSFKTSTNKYPNFIDCKEIKEYKWRLKIFSFFRESRYNRTLLFRLIDNLIRRLQQNVLHIERQNLRGYKLYVGSSWWSLTLDCIKYICTTLEKENIIDDFKFTCCPDEHFFQIIVMNLKFHDSVIKNNLRYVNFSSGRSSPNYITCADLDEIFKCKSIFARKFDKNIDYEVLEKIIKEIND